MRKEYNFEFYDEETGEHFIVCLVTHTSEYTSLALRHSAICEARKYFRRPQCLGYITEYDAKMSGYDIY